MKFKKPQGVRVAVTLLYVALIIGLISGLVNIFLVGQTDSTATAFPFGQVIGVVALFIATVILGFFYFKINQGRNWARILILVLFIIGFLFWIFSVAGMLQQGYLIPVISLVNTIIMIVALFLLFKQEASDWFKSRRRSNDDEQR